MAKASANKPTARGAKQSTGGLLKGSASAIVSATSGTDYAPATSGSSALKASAGGFANATLNDVGAATADYSLNTHKITSLLDPTAAQDAATKNYVDATAQGLSAKDSVQAATAAALAANTYSNGASGVGATLTATGNAALVVDGYTVAVNDRILVQNEATTSHNGIYVVTTTGSGAAAYVLTRSLDFNQPAEIPAAYVFTEQGTANADAGFVCTTTGTVTVGTTAITWTQFSGAGEITAGTGLAKSGNTLSIENSGTLLVTHGGTGAGTLTGLVKGNGTSAFTAATPGTDYTRKYTATIGDGSSTAITVTHSLSTRAVVVSVIDATTFVQYQCDVTMTSTSVVTLGFTTAPGVGALIVTVVG